jgi:hypothetical protein
MTTNNHERALETAAEVSRLKALGRTDEAEQQLRTIDELVGFRTPDGWCWPRDVAEAAGEARVGFGSGPVRRGR